MSERDGGARYTLADIADQSLLIARDKATLIHAAELLEREARHLLWRFAAQNIADDTVMSQRNDLLAAARALRELAA